MTDNKRLAYSIIQFLHDQLQSGGLSSDAQESLEVAVQCLETAFDVSTDDQSLAVPVTLPEIFASATVQFPAQSQVNNNSSTNSPTEEQRAEAERLKSDGRAAFSKLGNYAGAVQDCEQAIGIDPNYSKAYGRMGLNKHTEAVGYYKKALELDPDNDTYKDQPENRRGEDGDVQSGKGAGRLVGVLGVVWF
ncbi:Small glutamine-rich tetratricopeptide repeat-containing protein alpha [Oryzias melastigma]|uniref:Small glutamine-rich tetratricopeptide repeat-containing protein alpha n=1 Tax=Oryzias melastigma TaxID=30732 RepID=A0A834EZK7_ORYME|nr:Small glutamine-rich tetratricopeptide repeat-containing protein alpha [Oryzias melastigma]